MCPWETWAWICGNGTVETSGSLRFNECSTSFEKASGCEQNESKKEGAIKTTGVTLPKPLDSHLSNKCPRCQTYSYGTWSLPCWVLVYFGPTVIIIIIFNLVTFGPFNHPVTMYHGIIHLFCKASQLSIYLVSQKRHWLGVLKHPGTVETLEDRLLCPWSYTG